MGYVWNWKSVGKWLLVSGLLLSVTGCAKSELEASLPPLDSEAKEPCRDPGVTENPFTDALNHRLALAECEGKRGLIERTYERGGGEIGK